MNRTPKIIKQQTEKWLDERWLIANMEDSRPQDMSYYMGALKALEFVDYEWKRDADGKHTLFKQIGVMKMKIKNVVNNGVQIPNECTCIWCGSKMRHGGANRMGAGVNSFALWCDNCGAVVVHACDFGKKITGYEVKWDVKQASKQEFHMIMN